MKATVTARVVLNFTVTMDDAESLDEAIERAAQTEFGLLSGWDDYPHSCRVAEIEITDAFEVTDE
jgi:hypothetical protein